MVYGMPTKGAQSSVESLSDSMIGPARFFVTKAAGLESQDEHRKSDSVLITHSAEASRVL